MCLALPCRLPGAKSFQVHLIRRQDIKPQESNGQHNMSSPNPFPIRFRAQGLGPTWGLASGFRFLGDPYRAPCHSAASCQRAGP